MQRPGLYGLLALFLFLSGNLFATTYYSAYGQTRINNISVTAGTHTFEVDKIATYKNTEWYVNGVYKVTQNSGLFANDPSYSYNFTSGTVVIKAIVYNSSGAVLETHTWNVTVLTAPASPNGLTANAISSSQINLKWTDNSNNEDGFKIERKTGSGG